MLAASPLPPEQTLIGPPMPSGSAITVRNLAINAVLAGCRPEYFPVVLAVVRAMAAPEYRFFHTAITTHPGGVAIVVSGPIAEELGIASGQGCLGPGFRANATIGRAVNLTLINVARSIPGRSSLATHASPAQYSYCFAERLEGHPWQPLHEEYADASTSTVTVLKCEAPHNVLSMIGTTSGADAHGHGLGRRDARDQHLPLPRRPPGDHESGGRGQPRRRGLDEG